MSRKARVISEIPQTGLASPKIWLANKGYSEYRPDLKTGRLRDAVVILYHSSYCKHDVAISDTHPLLTVGGILGKLLVQNENMNVRNLVFVDISSLVPEEKYEEWMDEEGSSINLEKKISKPVCRVLEKMLLLNATVLAFGTCCQLMLKIIPMTTTSSDIGHKLTSENVLRIIFVNPILPSRCVNAQFRGTPSPFATAVKADIVFSSDSERDKRLATIRTCFPKGEVYMRSNSCFQETLISVLSISKGTDSNYNSDASSSSGSGNYLIKLTDLDATNTLGETIWMSEVTIAMNRNTKQYEQIASDLTRDMRDQCIADRNKNRMSASATAATVKPAAVGVINASNNSTTTTVGAVNVTSTGGNASGGGGATGVNEVGGLVLRGNRCVLVRSLDSLWTGMRIPSVPALTNESPQDTAMRSVTELCDIDSEEVYILPALPPIIIYRSNNTPNNLSGNITIYIMYAEQPPPDGPLEDQDAEDVDDLYDWYTWHRAVQTFSDIGDHSSILTMRSIACALSAASTHVLSDSVPRKWGGVFGQEWIHQISNLTNNDNHNNHNNVNNTYNNDGSMVTVDGSGSGSGLKAEGSKTQFRNLPIMILTGAFGSGKTALLQHIIGNQVSCAKIAVIVNTISSLNVDGAMIQQSSDGDDECSSFKVFEINSGCICCSKGGEILKEIQRIADTGEYDYCVIEAAAITDLMVLTSILSGTNNTNNSNNSSISSNNGSNGSSRSSSGGSYYIDNTVTVVDAVSCLLALTTKSYSSPSTSTTSTTTTNTTISTTTTTSPNSISTTAQDDVIFKQIRSSGVIIINRIDELPQDPSTSKNATSTSKNATSTPSLKNNMANKGNKTSKSKGDKGDSANMTLIKSALRHLNSTAEMLESTHGAVDPSVLMHTHRYRSKLPSENNTNNTNNTSNGNNSTSNNTNIGNNNCNGNGNNSNGNNSNGSNNISTMTFRSKKPFHPVRLDATMRAMKEAKRVSFAVENIEKNGENDEGSEGSRNNENESNLFNVFHNSVVRINGFIWLANYPDNQGLLSYTKGHIYDSKLGTTWWATIEKSLWPPGLEEAIKPLWSEPYGDRQVELILTGYFNDPSDPSVKGRIESVLSSCLLTDEEYSQGQEMWNEIDDPFSFSWD